MSKSWKIVNWVSEHNYFHLSEIKLKNGTDNIKKYCFFNRINTINGRSRTKEFFFLLQMNVVDLIKKKHTLPLYPAYRIVVKELRWFGANCKCTRLLFLISNRVDPKCFIHSFYFRLLRNMLFYLERLSHGFLCHVLTAKRGCTYLLPTVQTTNL